MEGDGRSGGKTSRNGVGIVYNVTGHVNNMYRVGERVRSLHLIFSDLRMWDTLLNFLISEFLTLCSSSFKTGPTFSE